MEKVLIIYSSETGNTKKVCEKAYSFFKDDIVLEKKIISINEISKINLDEFKNIIIGCWINKANADAKTRKLLSNIKDKNIWYIATLAARINSKHAEKTRVNLEKIFSKNNDFVKGILVRGKVSENIKRKMETFPLNLIHKTIPDIQVIINEADNHPNEEDFDKIKSFIENI